MADSTGITTTGKGRWIELKWKVKCNFIKLHMLAEEESRKILAFRVTDTSGGDAKNLPGMLDEALNKLGVPLEDRSEEPVASVEVESAPAEENTVEMTTDYLCDCGCRRPILRERRTAKLEKPPVALLRADGGYDSYEAFSHCKRRGVHTTIRVRIDSSCEPDDKYGDKGGGPRSEAVLDQLGGGCTAEQFAKMGKDERKKHQKEWKARVKFNSRWIIEIIISSFKRLLGEALRSVKPEYIMIELATKIAVYNKTRNVMREAVW